MLAALRPKEIGRLARTFNVFEILATRNAAGRVATVDLFAQFGWQTQVRAVRPRLLCNPVEKHHNGQVYSIEYPDRHLVCYDIAPPPFNTRLSGHQYSSDFAMKRR